MTFAAGATILLVAIAILFCFSSVILKVRSKIEQNKYIVLYVGSKVNVL